MDFHEVHVALVGYGERLPTAPGTGQAGSEPHQLKGNENNPSNAIPQHVCGWMRQHCRWLFLDVKDAVRRRARPAPDGSPHPTRIAEDRRLVYL